MKIKKGYIRSQVKAQIMLAGYTMAEAVELLSTEYGWSDSLSNFSAKLRRESLRYKDVLELADVLGVTRQTIISIENGKYNASLILAHKIAQFFETSIEEVFIFEEDENL